MELTFGKFKGQELSKTPEWYQKWLTKQDWFIKKFVNGGNSERGGILKILKNWDGYGSKGQAAYDRMFELEMEEGVSRGIECKCGLPKFIDEKYCEGDHCKHDF